MRSSGWCNGCPPSGRWSCSRVPGALFALAIYKAISNQAAIRDAKDKIIAHLLELRLFRDDLRVLLRAEGRRVRQHRPLSRPLDAADGRDAAGLPAGADPDRVALCVSRPGAGRAGARHRRRDVGSTCFAHPGEPRCRGRIASRDARAARRFERRDLLASARDHSRPSQSQSRTSAASTPIASSTQKVPAAR